MFLAYTCGEVHLNKYASSVLMSKVGLPLRSSDTLHIL